MMKWTTIWKVRMKTTFAQYLMRMDGNVINFGRRHERSQHINVTHRGQNPSTWQQQKDATDAWLMLVGFTILSSTFLLTPSAHVVISSLTTQQNSSAILLPWNIRLPRVIHL